MTNAQPTSTHNGTFPVAAKGSDQAPMVVIRLGGWINVDEANDAPAWIIPTVARSRR